MKKCILFLFSLFLFPAENRDPHHPVNQSDLIAWLYADAGMRDTVQRIDCLSRKYRKNARPLPPKETQQYKPSIDPLD